MKQDPASKKHSVSLFWIHTSGMEGRVQLMKIIIESMLFPPVEVFSCLSKAEQLVIEQHENYQKRSYRNRFRILASGGPEDISIPLKKGKNQQQNIRETQISYDQDWIRVLRHQLQSAYGNSPYYAYYQEALFELLESKIPWLFELNQRLFSFVMELLGWQKKLEWTREYLIEYDSSYCDLRNVFSPIQKNKPGNQTSYPYPQVFEFRFGFVDSLSILDLLFNMGPESSGVLLQTRQTLPCKNINIA